MGKCKAYFQCPASIDNVSYYTCKGFNCDSTKTAIKKASTYSFNTLAKENLGNSANGFFIDSTTLPYIETTAGTNKSTWYSTYSSITLHPDTDHTDCKCNSTALNTIYSIQTSCNDHTSPSTISGKMLEYVDSYTDITLANKLSEIYDNIAKTLRSLDSQIGVNHSYQDYMPSKPKNGDAPLPNFYIELNNALIEYNSSILTINVSKKIINAADSINKVVDNYNRHFFNDYIDCVCYADCTTYSVCFCYGNCNHY